MQKVDSKLWKIISNLNTDSNQLIKLAESQSYDIQRIIALHPYCPAEVLVYLSSSKSVAVRRNLAQRKSAPQQVWSRLSTSKSKDVLWFLCGNSFTPLNIINELCQKVNSVTESQLVTNRTTPIEHVIKISELDFGKMRLIPYYFYIAQHSQATKQIHEALLEKYDNHELLSDFDKRYTGGVAGKIARNEVTNESILERLSQHPLSIVRQKIAGNPSTPLKILELLAFDSTSEVINSVGWNETTPDWLLAQIINDKDDVSIYGAVGQPNLPQSSMLDAAQKSSRFKSRLLANPNVSLEALIAYDPVLLKGVNSIGEAFFRMVNSYSKKELENLASNPNLPSELLTKLCNHSNNFVRLALAYNSSLNKQQLSKLAHDSKWMVRDKVAQHPNTSAPILFKMFIEEEKRPDQLSYRRKIRSNPAFPKGLL